MYIKTQVFLVLGVSKSGFSAVKYLLNNSANVYFYEEKNSEKINADIKELIDLGAKRVDKKEIDSVLPLIDVLIISPGVPINHEVAVKAKQQKIKIVGELEFGFLTFMPTIVGITGTNGKTTTVSLLDRILECAKINHKTVGNNGVPVTSVLNTSDKNDVFICEVSSFQLESAHFFCPHISCILNISPDHLERHYNMENYVFLKKRIYKNQRESEFSVLNYDDETVKTFYADNLAKTIWVSVKERVNGAYLFNGYLCYNGEMIVEKEKLPISGEHNVYNALFAIAVSKLLGIKKEDIIEGLLTFKGVSHRLETVKTVNGVNYINDSKSTNTNSTISAISCMNTPTVLILGGSEKGETYDLLFKKIKESQVFHVILTGASRYNMLDSASRENYYDITVTEDFYWAVKIASLFAKVGDTVLLSPACASFDSFKNFEERGDKFKEIVESL